MNRTKVTVSSATQSNAIPVDRNANNFAIGFGCVVSAGGVLTYKIQHTFDDVQDSTVTPTWFDHPSVTGKTANQDGNYAFPIAAVRVNVTAYTSGNVTLTLIQSRVV